MANDNLGTFTFQNEGDLKTTIVLGRICRIIWNDHEHFAYVTLQGDVSLTIKGQKNVASLCEALGWNQ